MMLLATALLLKTTAAVQGDDRPWGKWQNSLKPVGKASRLSLTENGNTEYVIVIPGWPKTPWRDQKAAEELQKWLGEVTGAEFLIVGDSQPPRDFEISVGRTRRLADAGLKSAERDLGDEGYGIAVKGNRLFLFGGRTRGPLFAVTAFLEEDLGVRWYSPQVNRVPRLTSAEVSVVPRTFVPGFLIRDPFHEHSFDADWSLRSRLNSRNPVPTEWGGHIRYAMAGTKDWCFAHTLHALVPPEKYFKEHPEYYSSRSDARTARQLCLTHPDVARIATDSALQILDESPDAKLISISQMDFGHYCECARCQKLDKSEGSHAAQVLYFVNQVAEGIEQKHPDVLVSTLAYFWSLKAPRTLRPRSNVVIRMATESAMWRRPFVGVRRDVGPVPSYSVAMGEDPKESSFGKYFAGWQKVTNQISIWDYWTGFQHPLAPMPNLSVIADNIRFFREQGTLGVFAQNGQIERQRMRSWVTSRLLWDPTRDPWTLIKDFTWGYFGQAAPHMLEYNALLWEKGRSGTLSSMPQNYPVDSEILSKEFLMQATEIFDRAEQSAENQDVLHRVERERLAILYVKLMRGPKFASEHGWDYPQLIERFEQIERREKIYSGGWALHLRKKIQGWKDDWKSWNGKPRATTHRKPD